jgi:hypothetical protein
MLLYACSCGSLSTSALFNSWPRASWYSGTASNFYSEWAGFESLPGHRLQRVYVVFSVPSAKYWHITFIRPWQLPSKSIAIHKSWIIPLFDTIWPNPSSCIMALGSTQPLKEISTRNLPGGEGRPACEAENLTAICEPDNLTAICEPIV